MAKCNKCKGQGIVTKIVQLSGDETDTIGGIMFGLMTMGASLLFTTRTKQVLCDRCGGTGVVGRELIKLLTGR